MSGLEGLRLAVAQSNAGVTGDQHSPWARASNTPGAMLAVGSKWSDSVGQTATAWRNVNAPVSHRDPATGQTWTGKGRPPAWIAGAKDRDAFLIDGAVAAPKARAAKSAPKRAAKKATAKKTTPTAAAPPTPEAAPTPPKRRGRPPKSAAPAPAPVAPPSVPASRVPNFQAKPPVPAAFVPRPVQFTLPLPDPPAKKDPKR